MAPGIEIFGRTDVGRAREVNEDSFLCLDLSASILPPPVFPWLLAVADGIGGHAGGAEASALAVRAIHDEVLAALQKDAAADPQLILDGAFQRANRTIFETAAGMSNASGMGTTLVAALAGPGEAVVSNVGDSRAYIIRNGELYQITQDHSWAAEQRKLNSLTSEEIERSPFRTLVTRSLGYENDVKVDSFRVELEPGDDLFLCTDGLYGQVPPKKIGRAFKKGKAPSDICEALIRMANDNGGPDNITAVVARVRKDGRGRAFPLGGTIAFGPGETKTKKR